MVILVTVIHVIVCLILVVVVLLQSGKAADLAGAFGGMGSQTVFGPRGSATVLSKATTISAILFMITSITLSILATRGGSGTPDILRKAGAPASISGKAQGMNRYDDEYYKQWPFPVSDEEIQADGFLKSLTPDEEMALFLSTRGHCLMAAHRYSEAAESYGKAAQLAPGSRGYRLLYTNAIGIAQLVKKDTL